MMASFLQGAVTLIFLGIMNQQLEPDSKAVVTSNKLYVQSDGTRHEQFIVSFMFPAKEGPRIPAGPQDLRLPHNKLIVKAS